MKNTIYLITGNKHKFEEAKHVIPELIRKDVDLVEIQELDAKKIIEHKLDEALKSGDGPYVVEDVSLELSCLKGYPGPLIKWMLKSLTVHGIWDLVSRYDDRKAIAKIVVGYAHKEKKGIVKEFFTGEWSGTIVAPKGDLSFGWSPIFLPDGKNKTVGEMTAKERSKDSMRGIAFRKLKNYLQSAQ